MKAKVKETGEIIDVSCLYPTTYSRLDCNGQIIEEYSEDELEFERHKTIIYIVARPENELNTFIPQYITTHKKKAQTFWHRYNDESIQMVIFAKEWEPVDNNIIFCYSDMYEKEDDMYENNTLYKKYEEFMNMSEEEASLYWSGDENEEKSDSGMWNPKIWML